MTRRPAGILPLLNLAAMVVLLGLAPATPARANAPLSSLFPVLRPAGLATPAAGLPRPVLAPVFYNPDIRPVLRPGSANIRPAIVIAPMTAPVTAPVPVTALVAASVPGVWRSLRPLPRPGGLRAPAPAVALAVPPAVIRPDVTTITPVQPAPRVATRAETRGERRRRERAERRAARRSSPQNSRGTSNSRQGSICGDRSIRGEALPAISGNIRGCGIADPVRVTAIDGVTLRGAATLNCTTARALKTWLNDGVRPAVGRLGGGVQSLRVIASYSCRTRNSRPGARLSEHATGNAVDIAAVILANGTEIEVEDGWQNRTQRQLLRRMHGAACGPFGTVLGPDADRQHRDHFHLDVARQRGGPYCR